MPGIKIEIDDQDLKCDCGQPVERLIYRQIVDSYFFKSGDGYKYVTKDGRATTKTFGYCRECFIKLEKN